MKLILKKLKKKYQLFSILYIILLASTSNITFMSLADIASWRHAFLRNNAPAWNAGAASGEFHCQICAIITCLTIENPSLHDTNTCDTCTLLCECRTSMDSTFSFIRLEYDRGTHEQKSVYDNFLNWHSRSVSLMIDPIRHIPDDEELDDIRYIIDILDNIFSSASEVQSFDWTSVSTDHEMNVNQSTICCICHDKCEGTVKKTFCNHIFHEGCIQQWGDKGKSTCPVCRTEHRM